MSDFQPTTAIVTGSESGIGRATAVALAEAGMDIGITYLSEPDRAEETAEEVRKTGRRAFVEQIDVSDLAGAAAVVDRLVSQLGGVDVFVADAGTGDNAPFLEMTLDQWRHTVSTDLDGAFVTMQAAAKHMVQAGTGGRIIGITSVHEHQPRSGSSAYDAAKHGLGGLLKTMAIELAEHGITVNAVAPGEIATRMTGAEDEDPHHRPPRCPARPSGQRVGDRGRSGVPGLACVVVHHRGVPAGGRRDAADGPARRLAHHVERLAFGLTRRRTNARRPRSVRSGGVWSSAASCGSSAPRRPSGRRAGGTP
jgi:hypothetical protein